MQTQAQSNQLNRNLTSNFKAREFVCPCCYAEGIKDELVIRLQIAHGFLPEHSVIIITSGYRCPKHNHDVGGKDTSSHPKGYAADIKCDDSIYRFLLIGALVKAGFSRIGIGKNFIHADIDPDKVGSLIWVYN